MVGMAVFGLASVGAAVSAMSGNLDKGGSRVAAVLGAAIFLIVAVTLAWAARVVEHRVRTGHTSPATGGSELASTHRSAHRYLGLPSFPDAGTTMIEPDEQLGNQSMFGLGRSRRSRRNTPHSILAGAVLTGLFSLFMVAASVGAFMDANRSESVQHHGIPVTATVTALDPIEHSSRSGSYTTFNVEVTLNSPVGGVSEITVDTPENTAPASVDEQIAILVDRSDPSYAELPGEPNNTTSSADIVVLLSVVFAAVSVSQFVRYRKTRTDWTSR